MKTNRSILRGGNARVNLLLWLVPFAFLFAGAAAQTYQKQAARVQRVQADMAFASDGTVTAMRCDAFIQTRRIVNQSDSADVVEPPPRQVSFDLLDSALASTTITAAGKTVTYPQLAALIRQAAIDRATAAGVQ